MIVLTVLGIIFACVVKGIMGKTCSCICVALEMIVLFVLSIVLMVFGALLVAPRVAGLQYVTDNCKLAANN